MDKIMFKTVLDYALGRATEASTWAGVAAGLVSFAHLAGGDAGTISAALAAVAGVVAMILKEKGIA